MHRGKEARRGMARLQRLGLAKGGFIDEMSCDGGWY